MIRKPCRIVWFTVQILVSLAAAQTSEVVIPKGSVIEISWIAPPDQDVISYRAWFISSAGDTANITIPASPEDNPLDSLSYMTSIQLPVGSGKLLLTAKDEAGNQSDFSDPPAFYRVIDGKPGFPRQVKIKVF